MQNGKCHIKLLATIMPPTAPKVAQTDGSGPFEHRIRAIYAGCIVLSDSEVKANRVGPTVPRMCLRDTPLQRYQRLTNGNQPRRRMTKEQCYHIYRQQLACMYVCTYQ